MGHPGSRRRLRGHLPDDVPKVVTEQYPNEPRVTAPRFHGRHQLNRWPDGLEKCVGCELCAWACPADAIYVEGASNTEDERFSPGERYGRVYQINYLRCILCGLCIEACPTRALTMTNEYELADDSRANLIYEKSDLLAPLLPGMEQPPHERSSATTSRRTTAVCLRRVNRTIVPVTSAMRSRGRSTRVSIPSASSRRRVDDDHVTALSVPLVTGAAIAFWILAPVMVLAALGMILARKAVHAALCSRR